MRVKSCPVNRLWCDRRRRVFTSKKNSSDFFILTGQPHSEVSSFSQNPPRMNALLRKSISITASAVIAALSIASAHGQASKVVGEKPTFDEIPSPEFSGGKNKAFKPKNWLEIETKLKISQSPAPVSKTCDKITIKWYIAVKNPEKAGTMLLLTKDVQHVNLPLEDEIYCSIYLSPASIKRLTGADHGGKTAVEYVGYEILINGEKVAQETSKGQPGWWSAASNKISRSETVPLLNKAETPFSNMWWDRYAEVSAERR